MSCFPDPNYCQAMAHHSVLEQQDLFLKAWVYRAGEGDRKEERWWGSLSSWMMRSLLFFSHYKIKGRHCCSLPTPEMFVTKPLPALKWVETVTSLFWNPHPILFSKPPPGCSRLAFPRSTHFPAGPAVCQKGNCGEGEGALSRGMVRHFEMQSLFFQVSDFPPAWKANKVVDIMINAIDLIDSALKQVCGWDWQPDLISAGSLPEIHLTALPAAESHDRFHSSRVLRSGSLAFEFVLCWALVSFAVTDVLVMRTPE